MAGTTEELLELAQDHLDAFEAEHALAKPYLPSECDQILALNYDDISKLPVETCAHYACILEQYSLYLQRIINKEHAILEWYNNKIMEICAPQLSQYSDYWKYEVKLKLISRDNHVLKDLLSKSHFAKQKIMRLEYIPTSIKAIAKSLNDIRQTKLTLMRGSNG